MMLDHEKKQVSSDSKLALNTRIGARVINALNIIFRLENIKQRLAIDIESTIKIGVD